MTITSMQAADYPAVHRLWLATPGMGLNNLDDSEAGITAFLKRNPTTCFIAKSENNKDVIGVILAGHDGRRGFIYHLAVAADCRRQKLATRLVTEVKQALIAENIRKVALVVFSKNELGNCFWQEQGFKLRADLDYRDFPLAEIQRIDT